ncbi:MAG: tRNA (cytidine(34)-2'-O)-methyltransferase [Bacillota bacterium]
MNIVLLEPEIPQNTGNIGRSCAATNTKLHLIKPLGFEITDKAIRRSGMDYWNLIDIYEYENYEDFLAKNPNCNLYFASSKAPRSYTEVEYKDDDFIMFGKESAGIPEEILVENQEHCIRIPMFPNVRCLNLACSASIVLYEAMRQLDFQGLVEEGQLHRNEWKS